MLRYGVCAVLGALCALGGRTTAADTIYIDQLERPANGADLVLTCGDFELRRRELTTAVRYSYELLHMVVDESWVCAGSDGLGADLPPHGDVSLEEVVKWRDSHGFPRGIVHLAFDVSPPPGEESTTVVIKRLSLRLGGRLFTLPDSVVVVSRPDTTGELMLVLKPGFALADRSSPDPGSLRISAELAAPPGTSAAFYLTSVPMEIVFDEGAPQLQSSGGGPGSLPPLPAPRYDTLGRARSGPPARRPASRTVTRSDWKPMGLPTVVPTEPAAVRYTPSSLPEDPVPEPIPEDPTEPYIPPDTPKPPIDPPPPIPPPVPEPGTLGLLICGATLLLGRRRAGRR